MRRIYQLWVLTAVTLGIYLSISVANAATPLPIAEFRQICQRATQHAESRNALPRDLLTAISHAESGKWDDKEQAIIAWPWTVTSGGTGRYFPDKQSAIDHVRDLQRQGVRNIDVGCMQVNLRYHPDAFSSLEQAFDPNTNALYAAKFLGELQSSNKSWSEAIKRYHSANPRHGDPYHERVLNFWNKTQRTSAEVYRQSVIVAYKQRRAERQRERDLKITARSR
jgi:soluble lytic murein transglycosylase-like protein